MTVKKLVFLSPSGELYRLSDGDIVNIGGTAGPTFYVDGKALLFADGTPTDGSGGSVISVSFQQVYDNSNPAHIDLTAGKNLVFSSLNNKQFIFDAATGKVTITGDLEVMGQSTVIEGTISNVDQLNIAPPNNTTSAITVEPRPGVVLGTDLVKFKVANGGPNVFLIDSVGDTFLKNLTVDGLINGVDFDLFVSNVNAHLTPGTPIKHKASEISVEGPFTAVSGANVEEALQSIDATLNSMGGGIIRTYAHVQSTAALIWTILHNQSSLNPTVTVYDSTGEQVWPDAVNVVDMNTINVKFVSPQDGKALILLF